MGARETALNALIACRKEGAWSNGVLKEYIERDRLNPRDAGLATRLCYGVLQNQAKLDFYLKQLLTGKLKDLHPVVRDILHLGLYQIYELDKIPPVPQSMNLWHWQKNITAIPRRLLWSTVFCAMPSVPRVN